MDIGPLEEFVAETLDCVRRKLMDVHELGDVKAKSRLGKLRSSMPKVEYGDRMTGRWICTTSGNVLQNDLD